MNNQNHDDAVSSLFSVQTCIYLSLASICLYLQLTESHLCLVRECDRKRKRTWNWKNGFLFAFKKEKLKAEQSAGKSGESAAFARARLS